MFEFFRNNELKINPGYWGEKLQAVDADNARSRNGNGYTEFSSDIFKDNIKEEYDRFCEDYADDDEEEVTEAYPEETQSRKQQLDELWLEIRENVLSSSYDGADRAYDAAINFSWESDDGELNFDMHDFWEHDCNEYTFHYLWILYAIVWGIQQYDEGFKITTTDELELAID